MPRLLHCRRWALLACASNDESALFYRTGMVMFVPALIGLTFKKSSFKMHALCHFSH